MEINKYQAKYKEKYLFFYYNILVNIYSESNPVKAIEILERSQQDPIINSNSDHMFYILIQLAIQHFNLNDCKRASKNISKLYVYTDFKKINPVIKTKILIFEAILRLELKEYDLCKKLLQEVKETLKYIDEKAGIKPEIELITIIENLIKASNPSWLNVKTEVKTYLKNNSKEVDNGYLNYAVWLSEKIR